MRALLTALSLLPAVAGQHLGGSDLSAAERTWAATREPVRVSAPIDAPLAFFDDHGRYTGIVGDVLDLIAERTGLRFETVAAGDDDAGIELVPQVRSGTPPRGGGWALTAPYFELPVVTITRRDAAADLQGRTTCVPLTAFGEVERFCRGTRVELVASVQEGLRKVSFGHSDALVSDLAAATYFMAREGISNLQVAGETGVVNRFAFAVRTDRPRLLEVIGKGLRTISAADRQRISHRWVDGGGQARPLWRLLGGVVAGVAALFLVLGLWNRSLSRRVTARTEELRRELLERTRAQAALRDSEVFHRAILGSIWDTVVVVDADDRIIYSSPNAVPLFGYEEVELRRQPASALLGAALLDQARTSGPLVDERMVTRRRDGSQRILMVNIKPDARRPGELLCVCRDVTAAEQIRLEADKQRRELAVAERMVALGTLVSGVAHEVNNPTHNITLNVPLLRAAWRDAQPVIDAHAAVTPGFRLANLPYAEMRAEVPRLIDEIQLGATRIKSIIGDLRSYGRDWPDWQVAPLDLNSVVRSALRSVVTTVHAATHCFEVNLDPALPPVSGHAFRLEQVVVNLVNNACEWLEAADQRLAVSTTAVAGGVALVVEDEGRGIEPELLGRVTRPFFTTRRETGGSGLGLSMVAWIVKQHGGMLAIDSTPGRGTRVTVTLPALAVAGIC